MDLSVEKKRLIKAAGFLAVVLAVLVIVKIGAEIKGLRFIGGGATATNSISFQGKGEVTASPDIATISVNLSEDAVAVKDAQAKVTSKEKAVLDFLDKSGIDKKDIKTENYSSYPNYDYNNPCYSQSSVRCYSATTPKLIGYHVSEDISVKVRDLSKAGEIVSGLGGLGASSISGPNFTVENEDALQEQARKMAIDDAKEKAKSLSKDLGVHLVRIVNFSESGNYPVPYYSLQEKAVSNASDAAAPAPTLPTGETKITSNVTITYEIR